MNDKIVSEIEFLRGVAIVARGVTDETGVFLRTAEAIENVLDHVSMLENTIANAAFRDALSKAGIRYEKGRGFV